MNKNKTIETLLKKITQKQINDTIDGKCIFLCYQPTIPKSLLKKKTKSS